MTVLAWDGQCLAADRLSICGDVASTVCKIARIGSCLVGITGNLSIGMELCHWFELGARPETFHESWRSLTEGATLLVIRPDRTVWSYESSPFPFRLFGPFVAKGSGQACALGAMDAGASAIQAVLATSRHVNTCGHGYDVLAFDPDQTLLPGN